MSNIKNLIKSIEKLAEAGLNPEQERMLVDVGSYAENVQEELVDAGYLIDEQKDTIRETEKERDGLQKELDDLSELTSINLGLDTIHYRLENGNLQIRQRLENFLKNANAIPNAEILF